MKHIGEIMTQVIECIYLVRGWNERTNDYESVESLKVNFVKSKYGYELHSFDALSRLGETLSIPDLDDADLLEDGIQFELEYMEQMEGNL
jgi:hypothetical protein